MITEAGHELIAKYLLGQAPSYASYISFGCGADMEGPLSPDDILTKTGLNFELMRVPISSKAYFSDPVVDDISGEMIDERKIISLVGQLPFDSGMSINEVAVWSDSSNALASSDSRMICSFTDQENWMWKNSPEGRVSPEYISNALSELPLPQEDGNIDTSSLPSVFACSNQNPTLIVENRMNEGQGTRYLNRNIMVGEGTQTIFLEGKSVDLSSNSSKDELRFAFAMYPERASHSGVFDNIDLKITFMKEHDNPETAATIDIPGGAFGYYNILRAPLSTITYAEAFTWKQVQMIQIEATTPTGWYFAPDALRFDNISTLNPLYKMTGYTQVLTDDGTEHGAIMEHKSGTNSYAEFRFEIGAN